MPCEHVRIGDSVAIVCSRTRKGKRYTPLCATCSTTPSSFQCDWIVERAQPSLLDGEPTPAHKTCDAHICARHARKVGPDKHLCPIHAEAWKWHPANAGAAA